MKKFMTALNKSMKTRLMLTSLALFSASFVSVAALGANTISPIGMSVRCYATESFGSFPRLQVSKNGSEFYLSSIYRFSPDGTCQSDRDKIQNLIDAAGAQGKFLNFSFNDSPKNDFSISEKPDPESKRAGPSTTPGVSPIGMEVRCFATRSYGSFPRLEVLKDGKQVYLSSIYRFSPDGTCQSQAEKVRQILNAAKAMGKKIEFNFTDSPTTDFKISESSNPIGPRTHRDDSGEGEVKVSDTGPSTRVTACADATLISGSFKILVGSDFNADCLTSKREPYENQCLELQAYLQPKLDSARANRVAASSEVSGMSRNLYKLCPSLLRQPAAGVSAHNQ